MNDVHSFLGHPVATGSAFLLTPSSRLLTPVANRMCRRVVFPKPMSSRSASN